MLHNVYLHGALGRDFGDCYTLDIASPIEAFRALGVQLKGFQDAVRKGNYRVVRSTTTAKKGSGYRSVDDLKANLPTRKSLHIIPVLHGRGGKSGTTILIGAAIIAAAFAVPFLTGAAPLSGALGTTAFTMFGAKVTYGAFASIGLAIMLGGISNALAPKPKNTGSADEKQSFMFSNQQNVTSMGGPVPVLLGGPFMCGSVVVSASETVEQIAGISTVDPTDPVLQ